MHPEVISTAIRSRIGSSNPAFDASEAGHVISVGDGIAPVGGVESVMLGEMLQFTRTLFGIALNLEQDRAQYRELAAFAQFGSDLDRATRAQLDRGERLVEVLKRRQYEPLSIEKQIAIPYAATRGALDRCAVDEIGGYESGLYAFLDTRHPAILARLAGGRLIDDQLASALNGALQEFGAFRTTPTLTAAA